MTDNTPEYENALLSQILWKPSIVEEFLITSELFDDHDNKAIFDAIQTARNKGLKPDLITVSDELPEKGHNDLVSHFASIEPTSPANCDFYVEQLRERQRKNAVRHSLLVAKDALEHGESSAEIIDKLFSDATKALQNASEISQGDIVRAVEDYASSLQKKIEARRNGTLVEIKTGIRGLDALAGAIHPGEVCIVAARPSVGKTALATQIAMYNAQRGLPCAYFSLEMTKDEMIDRLLVQIGAAPLRELRNGMVDFKQIHESLVELGEMPLAVLDGRHDLGLVRARLRREKAVHNLQIAVVDYLGLLDIGAAGKVPRWEKIGEISRNLKLLSIELKIVLFLAVQLNREAEGKEPTLADLRDSGTLEQDADKVILLSRPDDNSETRKLHLAKNRHGRTGKIELHFTGEYCRFDEGGTL